MVSVVNGLMGIGLGGSSKDGCSSCIGVYVLGNIGSKGYRSKGMIGGSGGIGNIGMMRRNNGREGIVCNT
ncbi:hypothetical protein, partial [Staphylococcus capitis]|uniref:hypothetical protein n=1 Tax=Staphylococcus capitis TaxID=29388 RepID=UPI001C92CF48